MTEKPHKGTGYERITGKNEAVKDILTKVKDERRN